MTVQTETSRSGPYAGSGTTGPFTVGFRFLDNTHLQVIRTSSAGVDSTLVITTDYSVSGAGGNSGTVTLVTALAVGERLTVIRDVPFTQLADYVDNDSFPAESHENALDLLTMQTQQNKETLDRSLTLPATVSGVSTELPSPESGSVIGWNAAGTELQNLSPQTIATIVAYGTAVGDLFSGTGAQTAFVLTQDPASINNLDVSIGGVAQRPGIDYSWSSGTTLTFTTAPVAGTNNVLVRYMQALAMGSGAASDIQYLPAGAGAVATTVQAKLRESVSVLDSIPVALHAGIKDGTNTTPLQTYIQAAIDALPGTFDVYANFSGNEYSGKPSPILFFPAGVYAVTARILVEKNNVCIRGDGWAASIIKYTGSTIINEVIRFRNSHFGELSDIGLDGGLPYATTLAETYGANAGLCCDLTPFFTSRNLWIGNTRRSGLCAIHLWESFFENLQVRNTGWFTNESTPVKGAAIYFCADATIKESSNALGGGFESQNTVFVKSKLVPIGAVVLCEAPTQNITLVAPITEQALGGNIPARAYSRYTITLANNFLIDGGYFYSWESPYTFNATLFRISSGKPGIAIKNFYTLTNNPTGGSVPSVTKIFDVNGQHPVSFDGLVIDDANTKLTAPFTILDGAGYPGIVTGDIHYSAPTTVFASTLLGANADSYKGTLTCTDTVLQIANRNTYDANARNYNTLTGTVQEAFSCRAWCCFNGVTGAILASGNIASITKNSTGSYTLFFTNAMPDANYAATVSANVLNNASERPEVGNQSVGSVGVANRAGATYYDPSIVNVVIFR